MPLDQAELADAPKVSLGGKTFTIPKLAARQIKRVAPLFAKLASVDFAAPTEEGMDDLYGLVFVALTRAQPDLTREQFDDLPITLQDCVALIPTIAEAAGLQKVDAGNASPAAGQPTPPEPTGI